MNHKNSLTGSLSDSFRTFRRTGATFIPLVLFETLFMILVALAVGLAQIFIMESISRILEFIESGPFMSGDVPDQDAMGSLVRQLAIFQQETSSIINIFLYLTLAIFIIYIIFQGLSWKYCFKAAKIKIKSNLGFFIRFSLLNVVWFALVALSVYVIADKYFKSALAQDAGFNPLLYIIPIGVILIYFSMISYTIIRNNSLINTIFKTFSMGVKKAIYILPAFLIIAVLFLIIDLILIGLYKVSSIAMISAGFILIIPSIIWSKLFLIELINKIEKKK